MDRLFGVLVGAGIIAFAYVAGTIAYSRGDIVFENATLGQLAQSVILSFFFFGAAYAGVKFIIDALSDDY